MGKSNNDLWGTRSMSWLNGICIIFFTGFLRAWVSDFQFTSNAGRKAGGLEAGSPVFKLTPVTVKLTSLDCGPPGSESSGVGSRLLEPNVTAMNSNMWMKSRPLVAIVRKDGFGQEIHIGDSPFHSFVCSINTMMWKLTSMSHLCMSLSAAITIIKFNLSYR